MNDDAELLRLASAHPGRESAYRELVDRHAGYLHAVARSLTRNAADAEDLIQETFLGALKSKFRGESSVRTWLVQILMRQAAMLRRSRGRERREADPAVQLGEAVAPAQGVEAKLDLTQMLVSLSPEHREVIVLRELEGMSYDEMARTLGLPRGTVESRLHRARAELRERFRGYL